ncbi:uncharacterized protein LOC143783406 [Ranitomeya variabilis]|uniref:uncharacterized protein LOC143783406 n=1 Tax=Ranitomeya variabilis TaxID=490064 RepID=UPI004056CD62
MEDPDDERRSNVFGTHLEQQDPVQRVAEYVHQHSGMEDSPDALHRPAYADYQLSNSELHYYRQEDTQHRDVDHSYHSTKQKVQLPSHLKETPSLERYYADYSKPGASHSFLIGDLWICEASSSSPQSCSRSIYIGIVVPSP